MPYSQKDYSDAINKSRAFLNIALHARPEEIQLDRAKTLALGGFLTATEWMTLSVEEKLERWNRFKRDKELMLAKEFDEEMALKSGQHREESYEGTEELGQR